jgi:tagatose 6-phosphate kinase
MKVLTITLNPANDATYVVASFERGLAARVIRKHQMPGGKGNNVARILAGCGHSVTATGFLGGATGDFIEAGLEQAAVVAAFTRLRDGESRTCHTIMELETGITSEILEAGPTIDAISASKFLGQLPGLVQEADVAVLCGSAPPGIDAAFLDRLGSILRGGGGKRFVVDSSGETLRAMLRHEPDLIKPNQQEMRQLMGRDGSVPESIRFVRDRLVGQQRMVLLSRGASGALLITHERVLRGMPPPGLKPVNTVGCGDALLAGFLDGWMSNIPLTEALTNAIAFSSAAALQETAGRIAHDDVNYFRSQIQVTNQPGLAESIMP